MLVVLLLCQTFFNVAVSGFGLEYSWTYINFTWNSPAEYQNAVSTGAYIPENNFMAGIKFHKYYTTLYIAMPRIRPGAPVTMGSVSNAIIAKKNNTLITPFPSWELNSPTNCNNLLNVHGMEIDPNGTMWVVDGIRTNPNVSAECPAKLILFDLEHNNSVLHVFNFPEAITSAHGGLLYDIVIDDTDVTFAYIADVSSNPGIVVYSRQQDKAWKLNPGSMYGIALSPKTLESNERTVYFCNTRDLILHSLSTNVLKNESLSATQEWKKSVRVAGLRQSRSAGLLMDNGGDLYYGLIDLYGIGRWNIYRSFSEATVVETKSEMYVWPDSFSMDQGGWLHVLMNHATEYLDVNRKMNITSEVRFSVYKTHTGKKNYMYPGCSPDDDCSDIVLTDD